MWRHRGSSAGGLLAGLRATGVTLSKHHRRRSGQTSYGIAAVALLRDAAVGALLGDKIGWCDELSPARHVDDAMSPTFVWATASDPPGLPNALEWAMS